MTCDGSSSCVGHVNVAIGTSALAKGHGNVAIGTGVLRVAHPRWVRRLGARLVRIGLHLSR